MSLADALAMGVPPLNWWEMSERGLVAFVYGTVIVRLFGRRIFARWSALDVVIAVSMGSTLSRAITGPIDFWPAIAATTAMILVHRLLTLLCARYRWIAGLVEGRPVVLARDGVLDQRSMATSGVSGSDLGEALRNHGLADVRQTQRITLEPNGLISVKPR